MSPLWVVRVQQPALGTRHVLLVAAGAADAEVAPVAPHDGTPPARGDDPQPDQGVGREGEGAHALRRAPAPAAVLNQLAPGRCVQCDGTAGIYISVSEMSTGK